MYVVVAPFPLRTEMCRLVSIDHRPIAREASSKKTNVAPFAKGDLIKVGIRPREKP